MLYKYYDEPNTKNFETKVISKELYKENIYKIELEDSCFYPGGGGQPMDKGTISNFDIIKSEKVDSHIYYYINGNPQSASVECNLDWKYRYHFMIQHSGQHLISAVLKNEFNIDTLSVHLGENETTIEIDSTEINNSTIMDLELKCLEIITSGINYIQHETDDEGLKKFNIRRESKFKGYIRIITIDGYDSVPCGGVHINKSNEIGIIKLNSYEKIRGNIRLSFLIGLNAFKDYQLKHSIIKRVNNSLSSTNCNIIDTIHNLKSKVTRLNFELQNSYSEFSNVTIETIIKNDIKYKEFNNLPNRMIQTLCKGLYQKLEKPILILNISDSLNWFIIDAKNTIIDFTYIKNNLLPLIEGKGGGKKSMWQGSGKKENKKEFKEEYLNYLARYK